MANPNSPDVETTDLLKAAGVTTLAVANTDVAYSQAFILKKHRSFGMEIKLGSDSGTPDMKIEIEQGGTPPDTEGSADTDFTVGQSADSVLDSACNTALVRFYAFPPIVSPYVRLKFTGQGSNPATGRVDRLRLHEIES